MNIIEPRQCQSQFLAQFFGRRVRPDGRTRALAAVAASVLFAACVVGSPSLGVAAKGDCSQPLTTGAAPTASDCMSVLKSAIGLVPCALCVCDTNGSASLSAGDALLCLKAAVGQAVTLKCPACTPVTTTTTTTKQVIASTSTTTSSTSSTTSTLPVSCESNAACAPLGSAFRCNPFTGKCEKPCNGTKDCKDYLECNANKYCVPPLLLY